MRINVPKFNKKKSRQDRQIQKVFYEFYECGNTFKCLKTFTYKLKLELNFTFRYVSTYLFTSELIITQKDQVQIKVRFHVSFNVI